MTDPIAPIPDGYQVDRLVGGHRRKQLFRARHDGQPVALRLLRFEEDEGPMMEPSFLMTRLGSVIDELELTTIAPLRAAEATGDGYFAAEPWIGDRDLTKAQLSWAETCALLGPLAEDLAKLHAHRKWHGGIRPHRIRVDGQAATLVAFAWAATASSFTRDLFARVEVPEKRGGGFIAPELLEKGPAGAGTALDVYGLGRTLEAVCADCPPALARAFEGDLTQRATMADLAALLSGA